MATTVSYQASLRTRKYNSSSNSKSSAACQEFYIDDYNYVGIIHFAGMNLQSKVITAISMSMTSAKAGYGDGHTKVAYFRESNYQEASRSGVTGGNYYGNALGTLSGSFWGNTTSYALSGSLLTSMAAYFSSGKNTLCIYNPSPPMGSQSYSRNYLQWESVTLNVTYDESVSVPSLSSTNVAMGNGLTIYTNRQSTSATHTLKYSFGNTSGTIATGVGASYVWYPPLSMAFQLPSATAGTCTITCQTYYGGSLTGTKSISLALSVPTSVVPTISSLTYAEAVTSIKTQFNALVQGKSKLSVSIGSAGAYGSTISSIRTTLNGISYTTSSFITGFLSVGGSNTLTTTITDTRGRTVTLSKSFTVVAYAMPTITHFSAERCNTAGSAPQMDGTKIRITVKGACSPVGTKNTIACQVYYKQSTATAWTLARNITPISYAIANTNLLLTQTFAVLSSYDLKVRLTDYFGFVEQSVSVGTKQVMMDFYKDGSGIAFGKVAESSGKVELGWPLELLSPLAVTQGGTGANNASSARSNLGITPATIGAATSSHTHTQTQVSGTVPISKGGTGATSAASARSTLGITPANIGAAPANHSHPATSLPFKIARGSTTISGRSGVYVSYSGTRFSTVPNIVATYSTTGGNWSGDNGIIKIYSKTTSGFYIVVGGNWNSGRAVDWIAIGT